MPADGENAEEDSESGDGEDDIQNIIMDESSDYDTFGTVKELYREAEDAATVDENLNPVWETESEVYFTEESIEDVEELLEGSDSGFLGTFKEYGSEIKGYLSDITPNDKWDWSLYGTGAAMIGLGGALTGSLGLGVAGFLLGGAGAWRSYRGKEDSNQEEFEVGDYEEVMHKDIQVISEDAYEEIREEYQDE